MGGLVGLAAIVYLLFGIAIQCRKLFGRRPPIEMEFATRQDLKEQDKLMREEVRGVEIKLDRTLEKINHEIGERFETLNIQRNRDIGDLHEKINKVAEDTAFIRGRLKD